MRLLAPPDLGHQLLARGVLEALLAPRVRLEVDEERAELALAREVDECMQILHNVMLMRDDMLVDVSKLEFLRGLPLEVF